MPAKWQKITIDLSKYKLDADQRAEVADLIIETIYERTTVDNVDKRGNPFPAYSNSYKNSLDFKNAGKSKGKVDLQLSGDMLAALMVLKQTKNEVVIGFEKGSDENARADGNIRGTYGKPTANPAKARDFLGLPKDILNEIVRTVKNG